MFGYFPFKIEMLVVHNLENRIQPKTVFINCIKKKRQMFLGDPLRVKSQYPTEEYESY